MSIGLPLAGWDLVGGRRRRRCRSRLGEVGELVIGGVGLAALPGSRARTPRSTRPMPIPGLGRAPTAAATWSRLEPDGLYFQGRADDQVKVGGRRIELGEVDAALVNLPGVSGGGSRRAPHPPAALRLLVGYLASADPGFDVGSGPRRAGRALPAALVPAWCCSTNCPPGPRARWTATRCRGRRAGAAGRGRTRPRTAPWAGWPVCGATCWPRRWTARRPISSPLGGGSLSAAQLVPRCAGATRR